MKSSPIATAFLITSLLAACKPAEQRRAEEGPPPAATPVSPQEGLAAGAPPAPSGKVIPLTAEGFGALKIGMTEAEAEMALGGFKPGQASADCHFRAPKDETLGLQVMFEEGRASSVRTAPGSMVKSDHAINLGMTESAVRTAYSGALEEEPHKYLKPPAKRLVAWDKAAGHGVLYEIGESGKVETIQAGGPSIRYVEGCG